ncbi:MAG: hypothetical protein EOP04_06420 [Proteobacteria bacterium]|nr:MAG: hypothetical protein EOP04_06420 [Pseudomonadota bacterium]
MVDQLRILLAVLGAVQALMMFIDEGIFHRRRGLDTFERWGHVADTFLFLIALLVPAFFAPGNASNLSYLLLSLASCLLITKDEWIHAKACPPLEHWCHALLFILHGALLVLIGIIWNLKPDALEIRALPIAVFIWALYQHFYWNIYYVRSNH